MSSGTAISRWLQREMPRRGYPIGEPRSGGISRLAEAAGIPQASMSRLVNGRGEPSVDNLKKIGQAWGIPLAEMLAHAGMVTHEDAGLDPSGSSRIQLPPGLSLQDMEDWEQRIWLIPGLSIEERGLAVAAIRFVRGPDKESRLEELWIQMLPKMVPYLLEQLPDLSEWLLGSREARTPKAG